MKKNKILIVDDNKLNRQSLADIFRKAYQIVESEDGKKALEYLKKDKGLSVAAIILDLIMPVMDGFAFLEEFKKHSEYKYIPIVIATTEDNVENEKRCLEYGVWDFIPKSFHREIIWFRVMNAIKRSKQHFLEYDSLTGIYNRQMFYQKTREMLDDSKDQTFAFIRLDIDRFKMINSFYGAAEGDRLLRCMAHNICGVLSAYKTYNYGRLNSDVFGICVAVEKEQDALLIAQKIREQVKKNGELRCYLETSAGCYIIRDKEMEVSAIYEHAVIAAQECKGQYMHHEALYTEQMGKEMQREQQIINEMDTALEEKQFVVYFQPKYELDGYTPRGAEALVRWKKPDGTMVSPGEFIPVFERNGFITKLDYYVWEQTCIQLRKWMDEGKNPLPISVNLSRISLYNKDIVNVICNLVDSYRIPRRLFQVELTESAYTGNPKAIKEMMEQLCEKKEEYIDQLFEESYQQKRMYPYLPEDFSVMVLNISDDLTIARVDLPNREMGVPSCYRIYLAWDEKEQKGRYMTIEKTKDAGSNLLGEMGSDWKHVDYGQAPVEGAELQTILDILEEKLS